MKRPKRNHAGTEGRKRDIIRAALTCFSEIGYSRTSMADIRDHSRASTGSIYHHFKSKDQLAAAVYLEGIRDYQAGIIKVFQNDQDARGGIHAIIEHHLRWVEANQEWSRYLFRKRHSGLPASTEEAIDGMNRELMKSATVWFERHMEAGTLRRLPLDIYISLILGPCMENTRQYLSGQAVTETGPAVHELAEAAWRAVAAGIVEE